MMKCPTCDGKGGWEEYVANIDNSPVWWQVCPHCNASKWQGFTNWFWHIMPVWIVELIADLFYKMESE